MDVVALVYRLMVLMMGRYPMTQMHAAFVFGRAKYDFEATGWDAGILETAAELYHQDLATYISFPGTKGKVDVTGGLVETTYPGPEVFREKLVELKVSPDFIFPTLEAPSHTRGDSDAFIQLAKFRAWKTAVLIMQPHQALRSMLGILKSFEKHDHHMKVVPVFPRSVHWNKEVYGSQGALLVKREKHIREEWDRVLRYQASGDLASFEELDAYLSA